jgi:hypothetical protein
MKAKVNITYKDGSRMTITCPASNIHRHIQLYCHRTTVAKLTSQVYPFKDNMQIVHVDHTKKRG